MGNSSKIQPILLLDENACDGVDHEANNITNGDIIYVHLNLLQKKSQKFHILLLLIMSIYPSC